MGLLYVCAENTMPIANWTELQAGPIMWYKKGYAKGLASCPGSKLLNHKITAVRYEQFVPV